MFDYIPKLCCKKSFHFFNLYINIQGTKVVVTSSLCDLINFRICKIILKIILAKQETFVGQIGGGSSKIGSSPLAFVWRSLLYIIV